MTVPLPSAVTICRYSDWPRSIWHVTSFEINYLKWQTRVSLDFSCKDKASTALFRALFCYSPDAMVLTNWRWTLKSADIFDSSHFKNAFAIRVQHVVGLLYYVDKPPTLIIRIKEISSLACESYGELRRATATIRHWDKSISSSDIKHAITDVTG